VSPETARLNTGWLGWGDFTKEIIRELHQEKNGNNDN